MIGKNPKRDFSLFPRDWYRHGFKFFWVEKSCLRFNCWNNKQIWLPHHRCEDNSYYDYKPTDFYMAVTENDSSFKNIVCDIASNKQIETRKFNSMNENSITDFTKRYNMSEVTLYCRKCDPDFAHQDHHALNSDDLLLLVVLDSYLYAEEEICIFCIYISYL